MKNPVSTTGKPPRVSQKDDTNKQIFSVTETSLVQSLY